MKSLLARCMVLCLFFVPVAQSITPGTPPLTGDHCNTTVQCQNHSGVAATDCRSSRSSTSVCMCGSAPCNDLIPTPTPTAVPVTILAVPGKLQAEDFSDYSDSTSSNSGGQYRNTGVDIQLTSDTGGGYNIGWTQAGEWLEFDIDVKQAGKYNAELRVAASASGGRAQLAIDGQSRGNTFAINSTGGWQNWATLSIDFGELTVGRKTLRVGIQQGGFNLNWINLTHTGPLATPVPTATPTPISVDQCDSTSQCRAEWSNATDCRNSKSSNSVCLCGTVRCDSLTSPAPQPTSEPQPQPTTTPIPTAVPTSQPNDPDAMSKMGKDGYAIPKGISIVNPTAKELDDLRKIEERYIKLVVGSSAPSYSDYQKAVGEYNKYNIRVSDNSISGKSISANSVAGWLRTIARYAYHKNDQTAWNMAANTLWLIASKNSFPEVWYSSRDFYKAAGVIGKKLNSTQRKAVFKAFNKSKVIQFTELFADDSRWMNPPDQYVNVANTDIIYLGSHAYLGFMLFHAHNDVEKLAFVKAFTRWYDRVLTHTPGTFDFIKPDGTVFHHWTHTTQYIYTWNTMIDYFDMFKDTSFKMKDSSYRNFRDAAYAQGLIAKNQTFSNANATRFPLNLNVRISDGTYKRIAQISRFYGGDSVDQLVGAYYNQNIKDELAGVDRSIDMEGYFQFHYAALGVFRKDNWMVNMKGFNRSFWGAEIYAHQKKDNGYGRYQGYGILDVIYDGGTSKSGYSLNGYDWNRPSGSTTIVLPWNKLFAENDRQDERTDANFAGALRFDKVGGGFRDIEGETGMFAFDFRQKKLSSTHNESFTFKKSYYAFDDVIIALGSDINNNDGSNTTVTTLYQVAFNKNTQELNVGGNKTRSLPYKKDFSSGNIWLINEFGTGFYLPDAKGLSLQRLNHQSPNPKGGNTKGDISWASISHGKRPNEQGYEYVMIPGASENDMRAIATNRPYDVKQKNDNAHIVHHKPSNTYGYAIFEANTWINHGIVKKSSRPLMVMSREKNGTVNMTAVNPDLGIDYRKYGESKVYWVELRLKGNYELLQGDGSASAEFNGGDTVLKFTTQHAAPVDFVLRKL